MKRIFYTFIVLFVILNLSAWSRKKAADLEIVKWEPSTIYTDSDIYNAIDTVKNYFEKYFSGCTLTKISYPGDLISEECDEWAKQYHADEAIVLYSSFDVDSSGGDGSLNPNSTYDEWKWILVRNDKGPWKHVDHGY